MEQETKTSCSNNCADRCIPFYDHENTMMHYNWANRRMLIALVCVCVTFVLTILVFVFGYTIREKNWLKTIKELQHPAVAEVQDGQQNADQ